MIDPRLIMPMTITMVAKAFQDHKDPVALTPLWKSLANHLCVGRMEGKKLYLNYKERELIAEFYQKISGVDLITLQPEQLAGTRIKASKHSNNDKNTRQSAHHTMVITSSAQGIVRIGSQAYTHPPCGYLALPVALIAQHSHSSVIFVENLAVMIEPQRYRFPSEVGATPLLIYRGDPLYSPAHAKKAFNNCPGPRFAFTDYDPKGLLIAREVQVDALILPSEKTIDLAVSTFRNSPILFKKQLNEVVALQRHVDKPWVRQLLESKLAISQEFMADQELVAAPAEP